MISRRRLVALASLVALAASACGTNHNAAVSAAEAVLPVLARHEVIAFIWTDECEFIALERGAFSTDPGTEACDLYTDVGGRRSPIDAEAREVLDEIYRESEAVGPRVTSAAATLVDGQVTSGNVDFGHDTYWFEPGYTSMEDDDWFCTTERVNTDWYVWDC